MEIGVSRSRKFALQALTDLSRWLQALRVGARCAEVSLVLALSTTLAKKAWAWVKEPAV